LATTPSDQDCVDLEFQDQGTFARASFRSAPLPLFGKKGTFDVKKRFTEANSQNRKSNIMDKDRIEGSAHQAEGKVKETIGKLTGDAKLQAEGNSEKVAGKVQNVVGGIKDTIKDAAKSNS
jgi:uncharacterized protein YjbJ (UPF0337 family)